MSCKINTNYFHFTLINIILVNFLDFMKNKNSKVKDYYF